MEIATEHSWSRQCKITEIRRSEKEDTAHVVIETIDNEPKDRGCLDIKNASLLRVGQLVAVYKVAGNASELYSDKGWHLVIDVEGKDINAAAVAGAFC